MDIDQKYKGKATVTIGDQKIDVFDVTKEQFKSLGRASKYIEDLAWGEVLREREKAIRFVDHPEELKKPSIS